MKIKKYLLIVSAAAAVVLPILGAAPALAASASMSLYSYSSVVKGSLVTISIKENSGSEPVNAARATLSYPSNLLQFISISSSSSFSIVAANSGGGGTVNLDRGALPAVSGNQTVASVTFKALTDSGVAKVNITSGSVLSANTNADISSGKTGTSITLRAPATTPPPPPKDTTSPVISKVEIGSITASSAVVSWTTNEPSTTELSYGLSSSYGLVAVETNAVTDHKLTLNSPLVLPGTIYHFSIKSTDTSGNAASTPDATFTTIGATLTVTVVDQNNKPLSGALVEIQGKTATTNSKGVASLSGLALGDKTAVVTYHGDKYPFNAKIVSADKTNMATAALHIKPNYTLPVIIIVIFLLVIDYFIGWKTGRDSLAKKSYNKIKLKLPSLNKPALTAPDVTSPPAQKDTIIIAPRAQEPKK